MGDIVMAPIYEVLRRRGVEFEFFHRVDALHLDARRHNIDAITMGRQVRLADDVDHYEPVDTGTRASRLPEQRDCADRYRGQGTTSRASNHISAYATTPSTRVLRRGVDFDRRRLSRCRLAWSRWWPRSSSTTGPEWREMTTHVRTIGSIGLQIWLRPDHRELGMAHPADHRERLHTADRYVLVDAADPVGRGLACARSAANGRLLLWCVGRGVADRRRGGICRSALTGSRRPRR